MTHLTLIPAPALRVGSWTDYGELHRVVMGLFHSAELGGQANERRLSCNILFRVDDTSQGKILLISSDIAPTNLPNGARTKTVPTLAPPAGTPIRFRMTVNAIRRNRPADPSIKRGKGISPVDGMAEWVSAKLVGAVTEVTVFNHDRSVATSGRSPLQIDVVDGYGIVENAAALETLARGGVGRSKAFGCGLLTVARA